MEDVWACPATPEMFNHLIFRLFLLQRKQVEELEDGSSGGGTGGGELVGGLTCAGVCPHKRG